MQGNGKIEARGERKNMLATATRMLKDGVLALKDVARYSGLSLAQVKKTNSNPVFYGEMVPFLLQLGKELADFRCLPSGSGLRKSIKPSTINKTKQTKSPCPPFLALRMGD